MPEFQMVKSKETKGTYVYAAKDESGEHVVPTLYVKKGAFPGGKGPEVITITITAEG